MNIWTMFVTASLLSVCQNKLPKNSTRFIFSFIFACICSVFWTLVLSLISFLPVLYSVVWGWTLHTCIRWLHATHTGGVKLHTRGERIQREPEIYKKMQNQLRWEEPDPMSAVLVCRSQPWLMKEQRWWWTRSRLVNIWFSGTPGSSSTNPELVSATPG